MRMEAYSVCSNTLLLLLFLAWSDAATRQINLSPLISTEIYTQFPPPLYSTILLGLPTTTRVCAPLEYFHSILFFLPRILWVPSGLQISIFCISHFVRCPLKT